MWRKIVQTAHARGFSVAGALSGNPDPLKERTQTGLMQRAQQIVQTAYNPAYQQLDDEGKRAEAIADKRKADNAAFQQWLAGKQAQYDAQAERARQDYATYLDNTKAATQTSHDQGQQQATQTVQSLPGTVSNMQQSSALGGLSADTQRATGLVDNQRAQTAALIPSFLAQADTRHQAVAGQAAASESRRVSDLNTALTQLSDQRSKLSASKAQDVIKSFLDSWNQQVDIANSNRNYSAAADKLGLDQQKFAFDIKDSNRNYHLNRDKLSVAERDARARRRVDYKRILHDDGRAAADRALRRELAREQAVGTLKPDKKTSQKQVQNVSTTLGVLRDLHGKYPKSNGAIPATQPVTQNGLVISEGTPAQSFREYLRDKGASELVIDIAEDLRRHNGRLSKRGLQKAKQLGIINPQSVLW